MLSLSLRTILKRPKRTTKNASGEKILTAISTALNEYFYIRFSANCMITQSARSYVKYFYIFRNCVGNILQMIDVKITEDI